MEEMLSSLKVGKALLKMDAPNAPNPAIPNIQGNPDQNQDQVPAGQVPPPCLHNQYCNRLRWCCTCSSNYISKLDR